VHKAKKPKELTAILTDGKTELEKLLKSDEMKNGSTAEQMVAMVKYYNSR
jgi:hypothetical protein